MRFLIFFMLFLPSVAFSGNKNMCQSSKLINWLDGFVYQKFFKGIYDKNDWSSELELYDQNDYYYFFRAKEFSLENCKLKNFDLRVEKPTGLRFITFNLDEQEITRGIVLKHYPNGETEIAPPYDGQYHSYYSVLKVKNNVSVRFSFLYKVSTAFDVPIERITIERINPNETE